VIVLDRAIADGPLAQGEILADLVQYRIDAPAIADQKIEAVPVLHTHVVVLTQICDLQQDFKARFSDRPGVALPLDYKQTPDKYLLEGVLLCKAQKEDDFRQPKRGVNRDMFVRAEKNQHERYHCLGPIQEHVGGNEYRLFLDFKRVWVCSPSALYAAVHDRPDVRRIGIIPSLFLEHLIQRFHGFHARIGLPDPEDDIPYKA